MEKEIWKGVEGFEFYEVSSHGRVKSKSRTVIRKNPKRENAPDQLVRVGGKIINGWISKPNMDSKYQRRLVTLRKGRKSYETKVHHLVLNAFIGQCPPGMEGCHNDGDSLYNYYKNLRWDTRRENQKDSRKHGTFSNPPIFTGEAHHKSTISDKDVERIRAMTYSLGMYTRLAKKHKVALVTISRIYNHKSRTF